MAIDIAKNIINVSERSYLVFDAMPSVMMRAELTDKEAIKYAGIYPEWTVGETYLLNFIIKYNGDLYRVGQPEITASETYKPGEVGTESIYSKIEIDEGGYEVWKDWDGISGKYDLGQIVRDPNDNKLYKSKTPNNVWGPPSTTPDHWELYSE